MTEKIIIAGSGGQGIMLLGKVLAHAAMLQSKSVTWMPAYGPEVRGGAAHCTVVISDDEIGSPLVEEADTLIAMNAQALERFKNRIRVGGLLLTNSSFIRCDFKKQGIKIASHPFTGIASELGNVKVANMVALGCFLSKKKILEQKNVIKAMREIAPKGKNDLVKINTTALLRGKEL